MDDSNTIFKYSSLYLIKKFKCLSLIRKVLFNVLADGHFDLFYIQYNY